MRKIFLIKTLSFMLFVAMLMTSTIMPVNASVLKGDVSENISIVNEETISSQTTEEMTDSKMQAEKDVNNTESEISPRWANPDHRDAQCNYVISQLGLNSNQASWLKEGATAPDSNYKTSKGFHAREATNYMACLKAIFMYSQLLGNNDTGLSKKQVILNSMPNISSNDKGYISEMVQNMNTFIDEKGSTSVNQRKYIAYGFGLHLVGDMFAHRVMVKQANLDKWGNGDTPTNKYLQDRDFIKDRIPELQAAIRANQIFTAKLNDYMPPKGHTWDLNIGGQTDMPSKVYADNPTFMPKRFNAAKRASVSFVQKAKNGKNFSGVDLCLDDYNLSLHRYGEYLPLI